jgi:hypothetical protein
VGRCPVFTNLTLTDTKTLRATDTLGAAAEVLHTQVVAAHLSMADSKGEIYQSHRVYERHHDAG